MVALLFSTQFRTDYLDPCIDVSNYAIDGERCVKVGRKGKRQD